MRVYDVTSFFIDHFCMRQQFFYTLINGFNRSIGRDISANQLESVRRHWGQITAMERIDLDKGKQVRFSFFLIQSD